jgi:hypothetical protein
LYLTEKCVKMAEKGSEKMVMRVVAVESKLCVLCFLF